MAITHTPLLPGNATPWERLMAEQGDPLALLGGDYDSIRAADQVPPPAVLPYLVWEYGLGELSPYLPNLYDLIREGVQWQRVRGTPDAIDRGLRWLGYAGALEEAPAWRRWWNEFQLHLDRVRDADRPDLARIAGIVGLSPPRRSRFVRAFHGYDVRACETSEHRTGECLTSDDSGARIDDVVPLWSFGREYEREHQVSEAELRRLDAWIEPVPEGEKWVDAHYLWSDANFAWNVPAAQARRNEIARVLATPRVKIRFHDADGAVIGYARAIAHAVAEAIDGPYDFGTGRLALSEAPTGVLILATTGFGDGAGRSAAAMSLVYDAAPLLPATPVGKLWYPPGDLAGGIALDPITITIPFGETICEQVRILLRF